MITPQGFTRPTEEQLRNEIENLFNTYLTQTVGGITYRPNTAQGSFLHFLREIFVKIKDDLYKVAEDSFYSNFLLTAQGVALDNLAYPITRLPASGATCVVRFSGTDGTTIPTNFIVEREDKIQYKTLSSGVISGGHVDLPVQCLTTGKVGNTSVNTITFIPAPLSGLDNVTNITPAQDGREVESDADFRQRVIRIRSLGVSSSLGAIIEAVRTISGVTEVFGVENTTLYPIDGLPSGAFEIIVRGGNDNDIAKTIFEKRPAGIASYGNVSVTIYDSNNNPHVEKFSRPEDIPIYIKIDLTVTQNYENLFDDEIKKRIVRYIGGVTPNGENYAGIAIGKPLYAWQVLSAINEANLPEIPHIKNIQVLLGTTAPANQTELIFTIRQKAFTSYSNITITKTVV